MAFVSVLLLMLFGVLEIAVRIFWEQPPRTVGGAFIDSGVFRVDAECGWRMRANVDFVHRLYADQSSKLHTNSRGLRGPECAEKAAAGVKRVLVVGDSYAYGWGVDDDQTFAARLGVAMPDVEVINLGVSGYNIAQTHRLLVVEGLRYRPDLVVFAFSENDITDQTVPTIEAMQRVANRSADDGSFSFKRLVLDTSKLIAFLRHCSAVIRPLRRSLQFVGLKDADGGYSYLDENIRASLREYPPELRAQWEQSMAQLTALHETCEAADVPLLVATIPVMQFMVPGSLDRTLAYVKCDEEDLDRGKCARRLKAHCESLGVGFLDPTSVFQAGGKDLYLYFDMHFAAAGHQLFADQLLPLVQARLR